MRFEQLIEDSVGAPAPMLFLDSEKTALRLVIEEWLMDVGAVEIPPRVMDLRYSLFGEAEDSAG